jgi:uncharacterized integral membrane protein
MPDEFSDPKKVWQDQPTEAITMSVDEIRRKAHKLQRRAQAAAVLWIVIGLTLCVAFAHSFVKDQGLLLRIGWGILSLWSLYGAYQAYRWIWPGNLVEEGTSRTSVESYRSELERQRDYGRHIWRRAGLTFCFLGLAFVVLAALIQALATPQLLVNAVPFFVLLLIWFIAFFFQRKRGQQRLQKEIDELNRNS